MEWFFGGWQRHSALSAFALLLCCAATHLMAADDPGADPSEGGIKDNSFFIEEAYNQDQGVVQNIFTVQHNWENDFGKSRALFFNFTQEIPLGSEQHQFSYSLPFQRLTDIADDGSQTRFEGIGDMFLNYRYQLFKETVDNPAVAPRFSLILPTGDKDKGLGTGELGYQFNLPISKQFERVAMHFNAGCTKTPGVTRRLDDEVLSDSTDLNGYNLGGSLIWIENKKFQPFVEIFENWNESIDDRGRKDHQNALIISPSFRMAPYTTENTQIVLGAAVPIGLTRDAPNIGAFVYFSLEQRVRPKREGGE